MSVYYVPEIEELSEANLISINAEFGHDTMFIRDGRCISLRPRRRSKCADLMAV